MPTSAAISKTATRTTFTNCTVPTSQQNVTSGNAIRSTPAMSNRLMNGGFIRETRWSSVLLRNQYSSGSSKQVEDRSASVMTHSFTPTLVR